MVRHIVGTLWEPIAAHTKWLLLALVLVSQQWYVLAMAMVMMIFVLPGLFQLYHLRSGVLSLTVLADRMRNSDSAQWIKVQPYSTDDLIATFDFFQYDVPYNRERELFLIKRVGNSDLNHYCYVSLLSNVYIESVNTDLDITMLPGMQKFMIYHEMAHASFFGGDQWAGLRAEVMYLPVTLVLLCTFLQKEASDFLLVPFAILAFAVFAHTTRTYRDITTEKAADRLALRWICRDSLKEAVRIGKMLIRHWDDSQQSAELVPLKARLLIAERRKSMAKLVTTIQDSRDGNMTIDSDKLPWPLTLPVHFSFAILCFYLIAFHGRAPSSEEAKAWFWLAIVGFALILLFGTTYKVKLLRLDSYIQSRLIGVNGK